MSKLRNLPEINSPGTNDLFYVVESAVGPNASKKITFSNLRSAFLPTAAEVKSLYESNPNTNAFTDAEKTKLAGIEAGATTDQNAEEVPYDNSDSSLQATEVKGALDELDGKASGGLLVTVDSGRIVNYKAGIVHYQGQTIHVVPGSLLLDANVTDGIIYVDVDGTVKQTPSGVMAPSLTTVLAKFSTNVTNVIALEDRRVIVCASLIRGPDSDISTIAPNAAAASGTTDRYADAAHVHAIATGSAVGLTPDQANSEGSGSAFARADHVHNIPTGSAVGLNVNTSNAQGSANTFSRSDHTHAIESAIPVTQSADQSNAAGTSTGFAKADHIHNIPTGSAVGLDANSSNGQGSALTFAKSDHTHAIASAAPVTQNADQANAVGSASSFAKSDHIHNIPTGTPYSTGTANSQGSANTFAKSDHVHNTVVANSSVFNDTTDNTTSLTDVLIPGMTVTPAAGTYLVSFDTSTVNSGNGSERNFINLYSGGAVVSGTERRVGISGGGVTTVSTHAVVTVNGSQAIEARWRVIAGTGTVYQKRMTLIRLG
jgi:hypothetical protein